MTRRNGLLLTLVFVLATAVNYAVYASNLRATNDRVSIDLRVHKVPVFLAPTSGPTVTFKYKCVPNCVADKKIVDALSAEPKNERAARLDLDQTGADLTTAKYDSYIREAVIVAILFGVMIVAQLRTRSS